MPFSVSFSFAVFARKSKTKLYAVGGNSCHPVWVTILTGMILFHYIEYYLLPAFGSLYIYIFKKFLSIHLLSFVCFSVFLFLFVCFKELQVSFSRVFTASHLTG